MYETGTAREVRAFHVMPDMPPPEGERHSHDYKLDLVVSRAELDDKGMVVDLDLLEKALLDVIEVVEDGDLDEIIRPDLGVDAVTVEAFARWVHDRVTETLEGTSEGSVLAVRVYENPVAFGGYTAPID
jgi:6-pyruvoyltetrahydropterin/6-carboxytetrahydropterin synthase